MRRLLAALLPILTMFLAGCSSTPTTDARLDWSLDLTKKDDGRHLRYRIDDAGELAFAGGADVYANHFPWSAMLSDEQLKEIERVLIEHDFFVKRPATDDADNPERTLRVVRRGARWRHRVRGSNPTLAELESMLDALARRRHETFLDRLPKAGAQH